MKNALVKNSIATLILTIALVTMGLLPAKSSLANDSIHVWASPDLNEMAKVWVDGYKVAHPQAVIDVVQLTTENINQALHTPGNMALVSKSYFQATDNQTNWSMIVGRDVVVPVMNPENPYLKQIQEQGITAEAFATVFTNSTKQHWGTLLNNQDLTPVTCILMNDETVNSFLNDFLKSEKASMKGTVVADANALLNKIKADKYAIGFCKLSNIIDAQKNEVISDIQVVPIDMNANQKLDEFESIYTNYASLTRGLWIGKYPKELYSRIYVVTESTPAQTGELAFLNWVLTDGQPLLATNGFIGITSTEQHRRVQNLMPSQDLMAEAEPQASIGIMFLIFLVIGSITLMILYSVIKFRNYRKQMVEVNYNHTPTVFESHNVGILGGLYFDKTHTWAFMEKDGHVRIGIDDFMQHVTGKITKIKLKNPGESIKKGEPFLSLIQQGKKLEILAPVTGIIRECNPNLSADASLINASPFDQGWVYVIESVNWVKEIKSFLMAEAYIDWLKQEFVRLKDFLAYTVNRHPDPSLQFVMQDGGELKDHILESFGPEVWEEFQIRFINPSR